MANKTINKEMLTTAQFNSAFANSKTIQYWRANPVIACRDLLGIQLLDYQAMLLTYTWVAKDSLWVMSRNAGKTILASIYPMLNQLLFPEQEIWVVSRNGKQSKKLFSYVERLATGTISEFQDLPDVYYQEILRAHDKASGFSHDPSGHNVKLLNNSYIKTLNGNADNNRGERGTLVIFDENGFMEEKSTTAVEPYTTTERTFKTSIDPYFDVRTLPKQRLNQRLYISSASDKTSYFYTKYKEFSKRMFAGDMRYFVADINVDVPLKPTLKGKEYAPLLSKAEVDSMMATNLPRAMREYYNKFDEDGGDDQIIKSFMIERASTFSLPEVIPKDNSTYIVAYDPAFVADNAIIGIMKICKDPKRGTYGKLVNMDNFKDVSHGSSSNRQMLYEDQVKKLRDYIALYNGNNAEYSNIHKVVFDGGMGGGGLHYAGTMMHDYVDARGEKHRGIVDKEYFSGELYNFPNASTILRVVEPTKWKPIMASRLIDLMELGLIEFPEEYDGSGYVDIDTGKDELEKVRLSKEEEIALVNIDICKEETKMIHRYKKPSGKISYDTRVDMANKVHDDRFYVLLMLANEIYEIRETELREKNIDNDYDWEVIVF